MRNSTSLRIWISVVALTIFILTGSASLSAQSVQNSGTDIQFHKFVPVIPPENSSFAASSTDPAQVNAVIQHQVQLLMQEKASRTPAQRKIDSNVLFTIRMMRGQQAAPGVTSLYTGVELDQNDRIVVDIIADVSETLLKQLETAGALVIDSHADLRAIRALIPADQIETIAASPDVQFIGRKAESMVSKVRLPLSSHAGTSVHAAAKGTLSPGFEARAARVRKLIEAYLQQHAGTNGSPGVVPGTGQGSVTTEGDAAHLTAAARSTYGVSGAGLKIGVLSDSANSNGTVPAAQATGDLPPTCPGPGGPCLTIVQDIAGGSDEGAAMLEIIYDMAPGASLFFATADVSEAGFATNIQALQTAGCNIIVDDVFYFDEPVFQDGIVAQAVNTVTGLGALYFSSAGNEGNVSVNTSGYFEGDFNDTGSAAFTFPGGAKTGTIHNFGTVATPVNGDIITATGEAYTLNWADAQGASANDYDLFLVSSTGTVKGSSTNIQSGTQNPFEQINPPALAAGDRLVVFKVTGAASVAFAINTLRGTLTVKTTGQTHGHSSAVAAYSVAAAPAAGAFNGVAPVGPFPGPFTSANLTETFTSDGPRRVFFNANGTPITPGNFLFGTNGGTVRAKPDITGADGVHTTLPSGSGLNPFYGTSAAAPAAASVAALALSAKPTLTPAQMRTALTTTAIDIDAAGYDNVSGFGIVMAPALLNSLGIPGFADVEFGAITASENPGNGDGILEPGEGGIVSIQLKNTNGVLPANNITAVLTSTTPGVTVTLPGSSAYPNLPAGTGIGTNITPFTFTLAPNLSCASVISFTLTVTYTNGPAPTKALTFTVPLTITISNNLGGASPVGMPAGMTFVTGTQTGRISRTGVASVCGTAKPNPGLTTAVGARVFDAYTFVPSTVGCMNVTLSAANGINLYEAGYFAPGFVPATPSVNFAADSGSSSSVQVFGLTSQAGVATTFVVHDINITPGSNSPYTLSFPACVLNNPATANHPPVAVAHDVTVTATTFNGTAVANINNGSSDPDPGDTITLTQTPPGPYAVGVTNVLLTVTDSKGASSQTTANVTVVNPPQITTLSPTSVLAGSGGFTLTVNGNAFAATATVNFNGIARVTTFVSANQLTAAILASDVATAGTPAVTVTNPNPGGGTSNSVAFNVNNPVPAVTILAPNNALAGSGAFTLTVTGTNFVSTSVVNFNGVARATSFQNSTQVSATILSGDVASGGAFPVTVTSPAPGGGTSTSATFTVNNPVPTETLLAPTTANAGAAGFTLTVTGTNFVPSSVVNFNGHARVTTFVTSTSITAAILAADVATGGTFPVTVTNSAPGGGTTAALNFAVNNLVPTASSLVPNNVSANSGAFTLTVNGTNFAGNAVVNWNGSPRVTTFVSATQLTAAILASDIPVVNTANVNVFNPTPGGGTSGNLVFTITTPVPAIGTLTPSSAFAGGAAFTLTVTGSNFLNTSVVQWNGGNRTTTFVSATSLTAAITAADIAAVGTATVKVFTPTVLLGGTSGILPQGGPSGTISNGLTFTISAGNPIPTLVSLAPATGQAGGAAFTLTLNGTNFVSTSVANWKGSARATTFVSATQLTAAITAADLATSGTASVTVVNPSPGGGTSNALTFTITDFSVTGPAAPVTVTAGQSANFLITTAPVGGAFTGNVTFTTSALPFGVASSFNPTSVPSGSSTTMTLTTTARTLVPPVRTPFNPTSPIRLLWLFAFLLTAALTSLTLAKFARPSVRRRLLPIGAFAILLISAGYLSGCAGSGFPKTASGTPAGTYPITVTGTSGTVQHSTTVTLIVQ
jgi:Subtilase family